MERLSKVIFYRMENAIKTYRKFAQRNFAQGNYDITIDQWLILKTLQEEPDMTQQQLAEAVFKDYASITRIIELLVGKGYINRDFHPDDRRRFDLTLTDLGKEAVASLQVLVNANRSQALENVTPEEVVQLQNVLQKITSNCQP